ncbi:MAG TPA: gluconokinase [Casimicrobiaceae bacterium]|nr:gluconokinase [Casimicrobiaceae bacterium]
MNLIVMGVCGCGKTTVGRALAEHLSWRFLDADDFHPPENVAKMRAGTPLSDEDRWPWLDRLHDELVAIGARGGHAVLACSALKHSYRKRLARDSDVRFVYLKGDRNTIAARLAQRQHEYMPSSLLDSQFATLEEPEDAIVMEVDLPVPAQVAGIASAIAATPAGR